ncbi:MAG: leucine-rich repeat domain-containing protein [Promethearchaeota archaeon]
MPDDDGIMDYRINDYIKLRLEKDGETVIYAGGEKFLHCAFILLNISQSKKSGAIADTIDSIDEAAELLDDVLEEEARLGEQSPEIRGFIRAIKPETKFWAHCSNLQAWVENEYDTRLLRSNLAFPLLKRLRELGDPIAKKVFKEEIMKRFYSGVESVMGHLIEGGYVRAYLTKEDMYSVVQDDVEVLNDIERACGKYPEVAVKGGGERTPRATVEKGRIVAIDMRPDDIKEIPSSFRSLSKLQELMIGGNLEDVPGWIGELEQLIKLKLPSNRIKELPDSIGRLRNLEHLELSNNKLAKLPPSIGRLKNLR